MILSLVLGLSGPGFAEQISVKTYLSPPKGDYKELNSTGNTNLATTAATSATAVVGIGTATPAASAILDISSTTKGVLLPRLAAEPPGVDGLVFYNTTTKMVEYYNSSATPPWTNLGVGSPAGADTWERVGADIRKITSGAVGIGTDAGVSPSAQLTVLNGSVRGTSVGIDGPVPAQGAGTRLMWASQRSAFRAGQWTDNRGDNIGNYSFAIGLNTIAEGRASVALGVSATARGAQSVALGGIPDNGAVAQGDRSVAIGWGAVANGASSYAIGHNIVAQADSSFVIGTGVSDGPALVNNTPNSLMVGTNSDQATLFIGPAAAPSAYGGKVGIGTSDPQATLDIAGNLIATSFTGRVSDLRLKTNIETLPRVLERLESVRGVSFMWNESAKKEMPSLSPKLQIGVIAQELEKAYPELVSSFGQYKSTDYGSLSAVLLQAIHELNDESLKLGERIKKLKSKISESQEATHP